MAFGNKMLWKNCSIILQNNIWRENKLVWWLIFSIYKFTHFQYNSCWNLQCFCLDPLIFWRTINQNVVHSDSSVKFEFSMIINSKKTSPLCWSYMGGIFLSKQYSLAFKVVYTCTKRWQLQIYICKMNPLHVLINRKCRLWRI